MSLPSTARAESEEETDVTPYPTIDTTTTTTNTNTNTTNTNSNTIITNTTINDVIVSSEDIEYEKHGQNNEMPINDSVSTSCIAWIYPALTRFRPHTLQIKTMTFDRGIASRLVTSYHIGEHQLFWYRFWCLLYISWATGFHMFNFYDKEWKPEHYNPFDFWMYLTHIVFSIIWGHFLLSTIASARRLVYSAGARISHIDGSDWATGRPVLYSSHATASFVLFIVSLVYGLFVPIIFWSGVLYTWFHTLPNNDISWLHGAKLFSCINVHGAGSILVFIDAFLNRVIVRRKHWFLALAPMIVYMPINAFYTLVREVHVYGTFFWIDPLTHFQASLISLITLLGTFALFSVLTKLRAQAWDASYDEQIHEQRLERGRQDAEMLSRAAMSRSECSRHDV